MCIRDSLKRRVEAPKSGLLSTLRQDPALAYLTCWATVPMAFFTVSGTKLPHYILPTVVPLATLIGTALVRKRPATRWEALGAGWSVVVLALAQTIFTLDWTSRMKGVQEAAKFVRKTDLPLYVYKVGGSGDTSISLTLRETSHPSILFYLKRPAVTTDDPKSWQGEKRPFFVLTSQGVADSDPAVQIGLEKVTTPVEAGYVLFRGTPASP